MSASSLRLLGAAILCLATSHAVAHAQANKQDAARNWNVKTTTDRREALAILRAANVTLPAQNRAAKSAETLSDALTSVKVIKHFKGDGGIDFVEPPSPTISEGQRQAIRAAAQRFQQGMKRSAEALAKVRPLPACTRDNTIREKVSDRRQWLNTDVLYARGPFPSELREALGPQVRIIECGGEPGDHCAVSALRLNLRCLPTRFRAAGGDRAAYEGAPALRYFGEGKSPPISKELRSAMKSYLERDR